MTTKTEKKQPATGLLKVNTDAPTHSFNRRNSLEGMSKNMYGVNRTGSYSYGKMPLFSSTVLQPKLLVNAPGDKYEREADAMAGKIIQSPRGSSNSATITPLMQAQTEPAAEANSLVSNKIQSISGSGKNMDSQTNSFMSGSFGADFSQVKIHTDTEASGLNRELNANAFTVGRDIYFNTGMYEPETEKGKHLLAHELTHTIQQNATAGQVQKEDKADPTYVEKPEIDFKLLPPDFKLRFHHLVFEADTGKVQLDYQTRSLRAGLSYKYGDALTLGLKEGDTSASVGWTPGENKFSLGMSKGNFSGKFSAAPRENKIGFGLHYGDKLLPTQDAMGKTFQAGGTSMGNLLTGLPGAMEDPLQYYSNHKADIGNVSETVDLVKQVTDSGKKKIRFGADFGLTWDPVSKVAVTVKLGVNF